MKLTSKKDINSDKTLHVGRPNIGNIDMFKKLTDNIIESRWFTNSGQMVKAFEKTLCEYLNVRHCIPVCNGTVGLQIASQAMELKGEVIVPAFTFVASPHALQWEGIKPIFIDIDPSTHNLDPSKIESLISEKTSAILGVHIWGRPCNTYEIQKLADKHNLKVFFDAAHAFGCRHNGRMIGNFGNCEVFSFHATKFFNTFEGGAIATNDDDLAHKIRLMKNFGFESMDHVIHIGTNGKMSEICAAMGLACFDKLRDLIAVNRLNYNAYYEHLRNIPGIKLIEYSNQDEANYQYIAVEIDEDKSNITRDELMYRLHDQNIRARRYFYPGCHKMEPYKTLYPSQIHNVPCTDALCKRILVLPTGNTVTLSAIKKICKIIKKSSKK